MKSKENQNRKKKEEENDEILSLPPKLENNGGKEKKEKIICDFIIKEQLGEGTFGKVRLCINRQTEEKVAIKILDKKRIIKERDKKRIEKEIKILKSLRHPNIVHLYSDIEINSKIYLIMEYIQGTELLKYISYNSKLTEDEACFFFRQIISAIEYLHKLKIAHRDIKPENMIIEKDTKIIKLVDFGLSNYYNTKNELLSSACGSPSYAPPEMLSGKKYSASPVDVWSCGIVLYAMICGYLPFDDLDQNVLFSKIIEGKFKIPEHVSSSAKDLIKNILVTNPKKRYTIEQIKKHKWFKLCLNNEIYKNKKSLYEGLLLNKYVVPLDEEIINQMNLEYQINKETIRISLLNNEHNDITTIYDLILLKNSKLGKKSIADLKGNLFKKYLENNKNLLINYNNDINKVIEERKSLPEDSNNYSKEESKNDKNLNENNIIENNLSKEKDKNYENNENINYNISIEPNNNLLNNKINKIEKRNENYNIKLNKEKKEENNEFKKTSVFNEIKIKLIKNKNKENKILTPIIQKAIQINKLKLNQSNKRSNSSTKRTYNPKLKNNEMLEIKKPKSKIKINTISKNKFNRLFKSNPLINTKANEIKGPKIKIKNEIIINKTMANDNIIKDEVKSTTNLSKGKKHKTYRPNPIKLDNINNKKYFNKEDKINKTFVNKRIIITGGKRITKSSENRIKIKKSNDNKQLSTNNSLINKIKNINMKINKNNKRPLFTEGQISSANTKKYKNI